MSITKILAMKDVADEDKLADVAAEVARARDAYGNTKETIEVPRVDTMHGNMPFDMLDADSKVHVLKNRVAAIKAEAVEYAEENPGTVINKKIEEILATDGHFCNIDTGAKFDYI